MISDLKTRREFLEFFGRSATLATLASSVPFLSSCASPTKKTVAEMAFTPLAPMSTDKLELAEGFSYSILAKWTDPINARETFGSNNDYLAFFPLNAEGSDGILWVNHESVIPILTSGRTRDKKMSAKDEKIAVEKEMDVVGGSLVRVKRTNGKWEMVKNDKYNRRFTAKTEIPFAAGVKVAGKSKAIGTLGNCAGGVTPWGTVLTCEENYHLFFGETVHRENGKTDHVTGLYQWEKYFAYPPEHYGWVVEIDPLTGKAKKHTSIGRYAHECATVRPLEDGRVVVYSGDDDDNRCLYKFIGDKKNSLETGTLYVANVEKGEWISLDREKQPILKERFKTQLDVLIRCHEAALLVGGSELARPEDIEVDPVTGAVLVTLTNNKSKQNYFGSILKIEEEGNRPDALKFKSSTFLAGGIDSGVACPDNLAFDRAGNLWITVDVSGRDMNKAPYEPFKNNSLFFVPMSGDNAGQAFRVATAPIDAEFTGPFFSPDGKTLFLSVQHPGDESKLADAPTSHWPDGGNSTPRSAVVTITGPALEKITSAAYVKPIFEIPVLKG